MTFSILASLNDPEKALAHADRRARRQRGYTKIYYSIIYPEGRTINDRYDAGSESKEDLKRLERMAGK